MIRGIGIIIILSYFGWTVWEWGNFDSEDAAPPQATSAVRSREGGVTEENNPLDDTIGKFPPMHVLESEVLSFPAAMGRYVALLDLAGCEGDWNSRAATFSQQCAVLTPAGGVTLRFRWRYEPDVGTTLTATFRPFDFNTGFENPLRSQESVPQESLGRTVALAISNFSSRYQYDSEGQLAVEQAWRTENPELVKFTSHWGQSDQTD